MEQTRVTRKRILLVEDEYGVRACIKRLLCLDEHTITEASNGLEAIELFEESQFDVVVTDLNMPKMAGDQLAVQIRNRAPGQPIIMITACVERLRGDENPVDIILSKPFGLDELRQALADVLS